MNGSSPDQRRPGELRVYLGAAPGVGKTFAMLGEGRRRRDRGADVVVGFVETHGRPRTAEQIGDLEIVPRTTIGYRGAAFEEMDLDAVLARRPEVALVDELAHRNVPGSRHEKRWRDVKELLAAGIDVISTVNIQHLESLNDVVESITGVQQRETLPDEVVRAADQVELIDMTPEALRRRMAHGNIYTPQKIDAALTNYFRAGNLTALRELALLWVADQVDEALDEYRARHGISRPWETRERVVVAITGAPESDHLIRRAARIAQRAHGELFGVHVQTDSGLSTLSTLSTERVMDHRRLLEELGGEYREVAGSDIGAVLVDFARAENATQIVLGASRRSRWQELTQGSVIHRVIRRSGPIDVHVISADGEPEAPRARRLPIPRFVLSPLPPRRQAIGWGLTVLGLPLLTLGLVNARDDLGLPSVLLLYMVLAMAVAAVGGVFPALAAVVGGFLLANYYFTPPFYRFTVAELENLLALILYLGAAGIVSVLVDRIGRSRLEAAHARAEAEAMAALAGSLAEEGALPALIGHLRTTFGMEGVALEAVIRPVGLEEVIPAAVASLGARGEGIVVDAPETLPLVAADPALLERVLANLLDNAVGSSPPDRPVHIEAGAIAGRVDTRIVDQGPGIPRQDRDRVFQPFQRLVDHGSGVGLGLAISRGFVDAMGGELSIEDTPGGGVTMVVGLPVAPAPPVPPVAPSAPVAGLDAGPVP